MKKYLILCFAALALSCSKSDDNNTTGDPIFDAPYRGLKSLNELPVGTLKYAGNKIGSQPVGLIDANSSSCKKLDALVIDEKKAVLEYYVFGNSEGKECKLVWDYPGKIVVSELKEAGKMPSEVTTSSSLLGSVYIYKGNLEVGFQAGYLRIEDKMSNVSQGTLNKGKSYLYFHIK
ncbi:hypothetical protein HX045_14225 [Myroides odoratimimus]|uniref:hypothetical protein n=1 Tax=Myroides odoratimimus TaxID=76832 RepID=UPI0025759835|nr:hypothetical protein [Myroides odoratimimus]MDM1098184.1 hypothetical protein [Myroides odoratimimus]MDM1328302.1 hypothetical protein [Myroides odoratimimus]MDM1444906.1 hypothetical protein [Myroides odoratimimus]MDM1451305.1 hypothetical protein [Myroides odoratimimus]MDM1454397.1 hypothetical protein [Myroides odoratimimus]